MSDLRAILVEKGLPDSGALEAVCQVLATLTQEDNLEEAIRIHNPDVVVLDMRAPSPLFLQTLKDIQARHPVPLVIFSQDDTQETIEQAVDAGVAAYIVDSMQSKNVRPILDTAIARFRRYRALETELDQTRSQLVDRKIIERAKGIVMAQRGIDEDAAYQLMRSGAMKRGQKLVDVANSIIAAADLLGA